MAWASACDEAQIDRVGLALIFALQRNISSKRQELVSEAIT